MSFLAPPKQDRNKIEQPVPPTEAEEATNVILHADLSPIEHKLFVDFIKRAFDPDVAAYDNEISRSTASLSSRMLLKSRNIWLLQPKFIRGHYNEPNTLQFVEREALSIPAPRLIDTFRTAASDGDEGWFIMTRLLGVRVQDVLHRMSYPERHQLADNLRSIVDRMRQIHNNTPYVFGNVSGDRIYDYRASGEWGCGPFNHEAELNVYLTERFKIT
ncbi:hypothetical protein N0V88_006121 [Collariella sp. IMI 366227]|nr:hypothetical protein N0V88_006121 [Collariella sp. IMI 366227]